MKYQSFAYSIAPGILIAFLFVIGYQEFDMPLWLTMTGMSISILVATILFLRRMRNPKATFESIEVALHFGATYY